MANLIITSVGTSKLQSALVGGTKVQLVSFSTGYTSGSVSSANTSVPAQNYGLAPINSAQKIDDNSSQYECIVPESVGTFAINTIGLWDQDNTLFAIAKLGTDFSKIAQNLPTNPGNRFVWRPQIHISNISAVMNWTLNVATISNLNSVNIPSNLSGLAFAGQYKTYRVITMPDGDADIAISDGNNWSFGRYIPDFTGSTSGTATADNKIKGDATVPWKSYHVGSLVQINSGRTVSVTIHCPPT
jgi:phage-related tail fiber protein